MNKSYKTIWNESLGAWVAASELATGRSKSSRSRKATRAVLAASILLQAGVMAPAVAGALDGGDPTTAVDQQAYGYKAQVTTDAPAMAIGSNVSAGAGQAIAIGNGVTNNAIQSIVMGSGITLDANSGGSVVFQPSSQGGIVGRTQVSRSNNSFVFINAADPSNANTVTNSGSAVAIGATLTNASSSVGIGPKAKVTAGTAVAIGSVAQALGASAVSVGSNALASAAQSTAIGNGSTASGAQSSALGVSSVASGQQSLAAGYLSKASNLNTVALGTGANAGGSSAVSIGDGSQAAGTQAVGVGYFSKVSGNNSGAIGTNNTVAANNAFVMGNNISVGAGLAGTVVLGNGSAAVAAAPVTNVVLNGTTYNFAGTAPASTVSVGAAGTERQITNVAAGRVNGSSTDAVNGSQLNATNLAVTNLATNGVPTKYFNANSSGADSVPTGANSIAIGPDAVSGGANSMAAGQGARSAGQLAVAVGPNANASAFGASALGVNSKATGGSATALGNSAVAAGNSAAAVGEGANATGTNALAVGASAKATSDYALAVGASANASALAASAIGFNSKATGGSSVALGNGASASSGNAMAMGSNANASNSNTVAMGTNAVASGASAVTVGESSSATGSRSAAFGNTARALADDTLAAGSSANASGLQSVAIGFLTTATKTNAVAMGASADATGAAAIAVGAGAGASGGTRAAFGVNSVASGDQSVAVGSNANASAFGASAMGVNSKATGGSATALGNSAVAAGNSAAALGESANATGTNAVAVGASAKASSDYALAVGSTSNASGLQSLAVGYLSKASNANAVAVGPNAKASGATSAALGGNSAASGDQSVALGANANANGFGASALGVNSNAIGGSATALGNSASAAGNSTVALGESAKTSSNFALAVGASSNASGLQSAAVGYLSKASNTNAVAVGAGANAAGSSGVSVGANSAARLDNAVAVGNNANAAGNNASALGNAAAASGLNALAAGASSTASGDQSVAVGINSKASNTSALALGNNALASGTQSIAIGNGAQATGTQSLSVGTGNKVSGNNSGAFGDPNTVTGAGSYAFGNNNTIAADRAFVMGNNVSVGSSLTGAVVLGDGSSAAAAQATTGTKINGSGYAFAGTTPTSTVSVGAAGAERQITNVAAGRLSNTSTDAVNGSQLDATNQAVSKLVINGAPTKYFNVNSAQADSVAYGAESIAIGPKTVAVGANSVAMGNNANANGVGTIAIGGNSVASNSLSTITGQELRGLAIGENSSASGGVAVGEKATSTLGGTALGNGTVAANGGIALGSVAERPTQATGLLSFAAGAGANASGGQSVAVGDSTTTSGGLAIAIGANAKASSLGAVVVGVNSAASGEISTAVGVLNNVSGDYSSALGYKNNVASNNAFVMGNNVTVGTGLDGAVVLGNKSTVTAAQATTGTPINGKAYTFAGTTPAAGDVVSVGAVGAERQITNVAAGRVIAGSTDAINGSQLYATNNELSNVGAVVTNITNGGGIKYFRAQSTAADSLALGTDSVAVGPRSVASGTDSIAMGTNANASAFGTTALGVNSNATGGSATALGNSATASASSTVAVGENAKASSNFALAAGASANASGQQSVAVGYLSKASNTNAVALGRNAVASGATSAALGGNSAAAGDQSVALGANANASAFGASAVGVNAKASGGSSIAMGNGANASNSSAMAMGTNANASGNSSTALGESSNSTGLRAVALGNSARALADDALAAGSSSVASGEKSVAVGFNSKASNASALAFGNNAVASGTQSIAIGNGSQATGTQSLSVGTGNVVSGNNSGAFGDPNTVTGAGSYAFGNNNTVAADRAFVMGNNVSVGSSLTGAVVLGDGSSAAAAQATTGTKINGIGYTFAGTTPTSTVSVGAAGAERQITNVAAGRLSNTSTDAVNGSQLFATNQAVDKLVTNGAPTKYFHANSAEADSVAYGAESIAIGPKAVAQGENSVAMGNNANANGVGNVAIGANSVTTNGVHPVTGQVIRSVAIGENSSAAGGVAVGEKANAGTGSTALGNGSVAANSGIALGSRSDVPTSATGNASLAAGVGANASGDQSMAIGNGANASGTGSAALGAGSRSSGAISTALGGASKAFGDYSLAAGAAASASGVAAIAMGFSSNASAEGAVALGTGSNATGEGAVALGVGNNVSGATSAALGTGNTVASKNAFVVGNNVTVGTGLDGAVVLGNNSKVAAAQAAAGTTINGKAYTFAGTTPAAGDVVSVGAVGAERQITNVAAGRVIAGSTDAVNGSQLYATNTELSNVGTVVTNITNGGGIKYFHVGKSSGADSLPTGANSIAIGPDAVSGGSSSMAAGPGARSGGNVAVAIGFNANASGFGSSAMGVRANASGAGAMAIGFESQAAGESSIGMGESTNASGSKSAAFGLSANATGDNALAAGTSSTASGQQSVAVGFNSKASNTSALALGNNAVASGTQSIAIGNGSQATGTQAVSVGLGNNVSGNNAGAIGGNNTIAAANAFVLGNNVTVGSGLDGAVVLGNNSTVAAAQATTGTTINGKAYTFAGTTPAAGDVVSVGAVGAERQITNVAAGRVIAGSTDAVNGSQLYATNTELSNVGAVVTNITNGGGIKYFKANSTRPDSIASGANSVAIGPDAVSGGSSSIAAGPGARSGGQVAVALGFNANANGVSATAIGYESKATGESSIAMGESTGAAGIRSTALGFSANATVDDALAVGTNANASGVQSVALGNNSKASNTSALAFGSNAVASGTSSIAIGNGSQAAGTQAVSVGLGNNVSGNNSGAIGSNNTVAVANAFVMGNNVTVGTGLDGAVVLGNNSTVAASNPTANATVNGKSYTFAGSAPAAGAVVSVGAAGAERQITNVAAGRLSGTSTDAVNGSQLYATNTELSNVGSVVNNISNGGGIKYFKANSTLADSQAQGLDSVAIGPNAVATNASDVALGNGSVTDTAVATAGATINNKAVTFAGSAPTSTVSVGSVGAERTITNVAAGRLTASSTDAVNGSQLYATNTELSNVGSVVNNISNGGGIKYFKANSTLPDSQAQGLDSVAIGPNAVAKNASDVALGNGSVTDTAVATTNAVVNGTTYNFAGNAPASTVSVGSVGAERTITNVAAGRLSGTSTDAVNGSQLYATNTELSNVGSVVNNISNGGGIKYFKANSTLPDSQAQGLDSVAIGPNAVAKNASDVALGNGSVTDTAVATTNAVVNGTTYNFAGNAPTSTVSVGAVGAERTITNVAAGRLTASSTDAVNGSQLYATNTELSNVGSVVNNISNGGGIKYFKANSTLADSQAQGLDSVAIGPNAVATNASDVALGNGSITDTAVATAGATINNKAVTFAGSAPTSTVSVGSVGAERTITNVAAGRLSSSSTDAVNGSQLYATNSELSNVGSTVTNITNGGGIKYFKANSTLADSQATGTDSVAIGPNAVATNASDVALGNGSTTTAAVQTAGASVNGNAYTFAGAAPTSTVSVGSVGAERTITNVAAGRLTASSTDAVNGSQLYATNTELSNVGSVVNNISNGGGIKYFKANSTLADSQAQGLDSVAIGPNAVAKNASDVALGNGSVTDTAVATTNAVVNGTTYNFAGNAPASTVSVGSVGSVGAERTITNVAAGRLSGTSTDAVNGSQLYATNTELSNVGSVVNNISNGGGIKYFKANSTLPDSQAQGLDSVAIGPNAVAKNASDVALGNGSVTDTAVATAGATINNKAVTFAGSAPASTVSVGSVGAERTITNVAAGRLSSSSTDAVNGSQLYATNTELSNVGSVVNNISNGGGIKYFKANSTLPDSQAQGLDSVAIGPNAVAKNASDVALGNGSVTDTAVATAGATINNKAVTFAGNAPASTVSVGSVGAERTITNVAAGRLSGTSTDAVNGSQLYATNTELSNVGSVVNNISNGGGIKYFKANSTLADSQAQGLDSVAIGPNAVATNASDVALGNGSTTTAAVQTAGATVNGNAYTFAGAAPTSTVSVGSVGAERTITNVAAGRLSGTSTDAVNGSQLYATNTELSNVGSVVNNISNGGGIKYFKANSTLADSQAQGLDSVAIGPNAVAKNASDVALGNGSVTNTAVATTNAVVNGTTYNFAGNAPTSTVSVGAAGAERTITNVAAGRLTASSTDAVNGSQLYATNTELSNVGSVVNNISNGGGIKYFKANSTLADSQAQGLDSVAIGPNAVATNASDVALGNGSITDTAVATAGATINNKAVTFAGSAPTSTVSVGSVGAERTITNVAAGRLSSSSTDAVNGSQLYATNSELSNVGSTVTNITNGGGIKYFKANSTLADSQATGTDSVAIGPNAVAKNASDVALGNGSVTDTAVATAGATINNKAVTFAGSAPTSTVSVGSVGAERTITNVAAGRLSGTSTDAVNGSQLYATNTELSNVGSVVNSISNGGGIKYFKANSTLADSQATGTDSVAIGPNAVATNASDVALGNGSTTTAAVQTAGASVNGNAYTFAGAAPTSTVSVGSVGAERTITNVAAGRLTASSTDAVNGSQLYATNTELSNVGSVVNNISNGGGIKYFKANSTLADSQAQGLDSVAIGPNAVAKNASDVALGNGSVTDTAVATTNAVVNGTTYNFAGNAPTSTVSVGAAGAERTITNVAAGRLTASSTDAVNGSQLYATNTELSNVGSVVNNISNGGGIKYFKANSTLPDSQAQGLDSVAIGPNAVAKNASDVALGNGSVTDTAVATTNAVVNGTTYNFAGNAPTSTVSVGAAGAERTITNVAAGRLSGTSTDAVNGSQLYATNTELSNVGSVVTSITNGGGIKYFKANSTLADSQAQGLDSVAIGPNAVATNANDVALGSGSATAGVTPTTGATVNGKAVTFAGSAPTSTVSVGSVGAERTITNVAAGRLSSSSTDAVNGSQLYATNSELSNVGSTVTNITNGGGIKYFKANSTLADSQAQGLDSVAIGPNAVAKNASDVALGNGSVTDTAVQTTDAKINGNTYTFAGAAPTSTVSVGSVGAERTITNVAAGRLSGTSTDAVNGSQLYATNTELSNVGSVVNNISNGGGIKYFKANSTLADSQAQGLDSVAIGPNAVAKNASDVALGNGSVTDTAVATAGATINDKAVTFAGSAPTSTVSVGSVGAERTITNVAAGRLTASSTDAVNGSQLYATNTELSNVGSVVNSITNGGGIKYFKANSTLADSTATGTDSVAIGPNAVATNANDVALGSGSVTDTAQVTAGATINGKAVTFAGSAPTSTVSVGSVGAERTITNVAAGRLTASSTDAVNGSQLYATNTELSNVGSVVTNITNGGGIKYFKANSTLADSQATGTDSVAIGPNAVAIGEGDVALGSGSKANGATGTAGATINGNAYTFAGAAPTSTVSVGDVGAERTITNVAAGRLSSTSTDAVNGSQLFATNIEVGLIGTTVKNINNGGGIKYFKANSTLADSQAQGLDSVAIGPNAMANSSGGVALGAGSVANTAAGVPGYIPPSASASAKAAIDATTSTQGAVSVGDAANNIYRQINGVAAGTADSDAVNVAQLKAISQSVATAGDKWIVGSPTSYKAPTSVGTDSTAVGSGASVTANNGVAMGTGASVTADKSVALGNGATASTANSVALGNDSKTSAAVASTSVTLQGTTYTFAGSAPVGVVSVGSAGAERQITNVAAGQINANSTDAVNGSQLYATNQALSNIQGGGGIMYFHANSKAADSSAVGAESVAVGPQAVSTGAGSVAMGNGATSNAANSVALGAGSTADRTGMAGQKELFSNTVVNSTQGAVSVGSAGNERQITNVAGGTEATDAVNVRQLQSVKAGSVQYDTNADGTVNQNSITLGGSSSSATAIHNVAAGVAGTDAANVDQVKQMGQEANAYTDLRSNQLRADIQTTAKDASAGTAGAMAMAGMPQAAIPGKSMWTAGAAAYDGQAAIAIGVSKLADNGRWVIKFSGSANSRGKTGVSVGAGFHW